MTLQMSEELNHLGTSNATGMQLEVKIPPSDSGHGRKRFPIKRVLQHRGLSSRRPRPTAVRSLAESALINEHYRAPFALGFFLSSGQRLLFQRAIATSSLCKALPVGRWQLQPSRPNSHQTWPTVNRTPQFCSIRSATRLNVHRFVSYPSACGPRFKARSIPLSSTWLSRGLRPALPVFFSPARPDSATCLAHRLTDCRWTPSCRATSAWCTPCLNSANARKRRCSNASKSLLTPAGFPMQEIVPQSHENVTIFYENQ